MPSIAYRTCILIKIAYDRYMKLRLQALVLILSFVLAFVCHQSPLSGFTVPLVGIYIVLYIVLSAGRKAKAS